MKSKKPIHIIPLQNCGGERFPNNKRRLNTYKSPVVYFGKSWT